MNACNFALTLFVAPPIDCLPAALFQPDLPQDLGYFYLIRGSRYALGEYYTRGFEIRSFPREMI